MCHHLFCLLLILHYLYIYLLPVSETFFQTLTNLFLNSFLLFISSSLLASPDHHYPSSAPFPPLSCFCSYSFPASFSLLIFAFPCSFFFFFFLFILLLLLLLPSAVPSIILLSSSLSFFCSCPFLFLVQFLLLFLLFFNSLLLFNFLSPALPCSYFFLQFLLFLLVYLLRLCSPPPPCLEPNHSSGPLPVMNSQIILRHKSSQWPPILWAARFHHFPQGQPIIIASSLRATEELGMDPLKPPALQLPLLPPPPPPSPTPLTHILLRKNC